MDKTFEKLKEIISDCLGVIVTDRVCKVTFICENELERKILNINIKDWFNIFLDVKRFETLGDIEDFINRTKQMEIKND